MKFDNSELPQYRRCYSSVLQYGSNDPEACLKESIFQYGETFISDSKVRQCCRNFKAGCIDV